MFNKKLSKSIALSLILTSISIPMINSSYAIDKSKQNIELIDEEQNIDNDIFSQQLIENVIIEGISYEYKYYYNENGLPTISTINLNTNKIDIFEFDNNNNVIYLNGESIMSFTEKKDFNVFSEKDSKRHLTAGPAHIKITWVLGASISVVSTAIAGALKLPASVIVKVMGRALKELANKATGGTLHFSRYYRDLALGQVQYRTDWSFVASNNKRYGTYNYYSTPQ